MYEIKIHRDAKADLLQIAVDAQDVAAKISQFLQEAKSNQQLLDNFTAHEYGRIPRDRYHVSKWLDQYQQGRNLWRFKLWTLEDQRHFYRVVYGFFPPKLYVVLGVVRHDYRQPSDFDYRESDAFTERVTALYDRLASQT